jgi:hypothetical protein
MPCGYVEGFLRMDIRLETVGVMLVKCIEYHLPPLLAFFVGLASKVECVILSADLALNIG